MSHVAGSEPYAWPYDGTIDGGSLALVLAGWDETWHGRAVEGLDAATASCAALAAAVEALGGLVVTVAHGAPPLPPPGGGGALAVDAVGLDGFWGGPLDSVLRAGRRTHLLVAGHGLEGPVHSLLRGANDRGLECLLVVDACSALTDDCRAAAASTVCMSGGIFGAVGTTVAVLESLALDQELIP